MIWLQIVLLSMWVPGKHRSLLTWTDSILGVAMILRWVMPWKRLAFGIRFMMVIRG